MSDPYIEQKPSRRLWILAVLAALALHLGGAALAVTHLRTNTRYDGLGASGAEFAVEMVSPKVPDDDLPPGPETEAMKASPEHPDQTAEVKDTNLPKARPTEAEDPDRIVMPNDSKRPTEEEPKVVAVQTEAAEEVPNQIETSRRILDERAPEADRARAPNLGIGKDRQKLTADWGRKISAYFDLHKRYPKDTRKSAKVKVSLVLNRRGNVVSVDVAESSGDPAFDDAALSMIRRSDPVPKPPAGLTDDQFSFNLDVNFNKPKAK
jgi:periplasmic protein TonB